MTQVEQRQGGAFLTGTGADFLVWSGSADMIELCLFDHAGEEELARLPMTRGEGDVHRLHVEGVQEGARYGYRAYGRYAPEHGFWFDPSKLLVDPYAKQIDRPYIYDKRLTVFGEQTASLVPKSVVTRDHPAKLIMPMFEPGGLVYEVPVRPFTILHPDIPENLRGTIGALAHPAAIAHLKRIGVDTVELMPITAWIDERHLPPLGLTNGWGYNPVTMMAIDPRLAPGGVAELRHTVATLHSEGIGVILDLVFNHTGESDRLGPTLSLRGLDNLACYRHLPDNPGILVNDTGCGNTLACDHIYVRRMIIDTLRHFVLNAGVDGFRFDLGPILGRTVTGFHSTSRTLHAITADEVLEDRIMIAEPWDVGPGGYQLGNFPPPYLEWNDQARDTIRRFWRGDNHMVGKLATALAGSSDVFSKHGGVSTRSVNFIAAHDGFTLLDLVSHSHKRNGKNGENNRDGHDENYSWNNGDEGKTTNRTVIARRHSDVIALLSTLFATRGAIMLTAGDEGGRTQNGNNNAYCQDNELTWLDWDSLDQELIDHTAFVAAMRKRFSVFAETGFFNGEGHDVEWLSADGNPMTIPEWEAAETSVLTMVLKTLDLKTRKPVRIAIAFNRSHDACTIELRSAPDLKWHKLSSGRSSKAIKLKPRSVEFFIEN